MRRFAICTLSLLCFGIVSTGADAADDEDMLTTFWQEQRQAPQPRAVTGSSTAKGLVGVEFNTTVRNLLAKAEPDECFTEIGGPRTSPPCAGGAQEKVNEDDGDFIDSTEVSEWSDIRSFANLGSSLYAGVGSPENGDPAGGRVLRWTGSAGDPFDFAEVEFLPGEIVASLTPHDGRLAAGTWPVPTELGLGDSAGVWISPDPGDGVLEDTDGAFTKIWAAGDGDPDELATLLTGVGAMASYGGSLFWGTMHAPLLGTAAHFGFYGAFYDAIGSTSTSDPEEAFLLAGLLGIAGAIVLKRSI